VTLSEAPVLLLTGASGLVGGELLKCFLASRPTRRIVAVTRKDRYRAGYGGVRVVQGDIRRSDLGLSSSVSSELATNVTEIVHCAAETSFSVPLAEIRETNVDGTRNLLKFAFRCSKLQKIAHVSTIFASGCTSGRIPEAILMQRPRRFLNTYQESKYEAEEVVADFTRKLPIVILRLSSIIGNSQTGAVPQFNYVHQLIKLFPYNVLPVVPAHSDTRVDLIAADWVARAITYIFENKSCSGVYNLCAGWDHGIGVQELIDLTEEIFRSHPKGQRFLPIKIPELVALSAYEDFVQKSQQSKDALLGELLRVLGRFLPHLGIYQHFENSLAMSALEGSGLQLPSVRDLYKKVVVHCLETNWGTTRSE
jgi:nucleoside-diphosphate-sugar epimerase